MKEDESIKTTEDKDFEDMKDRIIQKDDNLHQIMEEYNQSKFKGLMSFAEYVHFDYLMKIEQLLYEDSEEAKDSRNI